MGLEQFLVGLLICLVMAIVGSLLSLYMNWITNEDSIDGLGFWLMMILMSVGFGICLTYIGYMKGVL